MHELSIADAIVEIAARNAGDRRVVRVEVQVGDLRQVAPSALAFAFELVATGTPVQGAELALERVRVRGVCRTCPGTREVDGFPLRCAACGGDVEVTQGEELRVLSLELEDRPMATTTRRTET
jgi:hydrogenase nickel incorporation protein HypA/HybF